MSGLRMGIPEACLHVVHGVPGAARSRRHSKTSSLEVMSEVEGTILSGNRMNAQPRKIRGLDGLRALAVIAVIIFHVRPASLPGGFIGVDIFFVVSGFLITTLLVREIIKTRGLNLPRFWLRRARRLLPALVLVVLVSVTGGLILGDDLLVGIGRQSLGALTFSTNWVEIVAGTSYFAGTSPQLFAHFWSLAVEEQFYLLWPLLFMGLMLVVKSWHWRIGVAAGGAVVSAILMAIIHTPGSDVTRVYYGTDTHAFGLLLGVALAFVWAGTPWLKDPRFVLLSPYLAPAALLGILALMRALDENSAFTFRGGLFLASALTALLIASLLPRNRRLLAVAEFRPLVWVGKRSYGLYLWHWPVLLLLTALAPPAAVDSLLNWVVRGLAVAATVAISAWSYRSLEMPVRTRGFRACWRQAVADVRGPERVPKIALAAAFLLVIGTSIGLATAPSKSSVQAAIEEGQRHISGTAAEGAAAEPSGSPKSATKQPTDPATPTIANFAVPTGEEISGFGDSLLVTSVGGLNAVFPGIYLDAVSNRQWQHAEGVVSAALEAGLVRRAVIIDFGTNAGVPDSDAVRRVLDMLGPDRMVVVVNLYGTSTFIEPANEELANIVAEYPNAIIADWYSAVSAQPDMLQSDQTHPNIPGAQLFAETVQSAFQQLSDRISSQQSQG